MLRQKILRELEQLPDSKLAELYEVIRQLREEAEPKSLEPRTPGALSGKLGDAFFEPLPEEELQRWE